MPADTTARSLDGKVALVTGSGRGVGAAIIEKLATQGASVVINYIQSSCAAEEVARKARALGVRAIIVKADAAQRDGIAHLFRVARAELGRIDIVMSSAGTEHFGGSIGGSHDGQEREKEKERTKEITEDDIDRVLAVNVKAQLMVAQQAHRYLEDGGRLIMISSVSAVTGREKGVPNHALYAASKSAVMGMTRSLAHDFGRRGITVNCIAPGDAAKTTTMDEEDEDENARIYEPGADGEMTLQEIDAANPSKSSSSPLGAGAPDFSNDVAGVVAFLSTPEAQWITGYTIRVPACGTQTT